MALKPEQKNRDILRLSNEASNRFTKECIETALLVLMKEKNFNDISITDIVERAGVSRSAYYRNYSSKKDILNKYLQTIVETITDSLDLHKNHHNDFNFWLSVFTRVRTYADEFMILQKAGFDAIILSSINETMVEQISNRDKQVFEKYEMLFWVGAFYNLLREWVIYGMKESNEDMAQIGQKMSMNFSYVGRDEPL
ncbi:TetR/AcrR family transcriptional regulator [Amphibacillus indicireducens]|uniref:TetR/AcrR family transcriptional regulator n=1 Tax=Amphibacillus indicireducens TaxID=1076330 RepID=A0ABP7VGK5_9BACI